MVLSAWHRGPDRCWVRRAGDVYLLRSIGKYTEYAAGVVLNFGGQETVLGYDRGAATVSLFRLLIGERLCFSILREQHKQGAERGRLDGCCLWARFGIVTMFLSDVDCYKSVLLDSCTSVGSAGGVILDNVRDRERMCVCMREDE